MHIGAHLSISGGHANAIAKAVDIGCDSLQIFSISPRGWDLARVSDADIEAFTTAARKENMRHIYFHASYLVNLADPGRIGHLSKVTLKHELALASRMGVKGSIVHLGSFKEKSESPSLLDLFPDKYATLIENIGEVLNETPPETFFIMENAGNRKIGKSMEEVFKIVKDVASPRMKVCLDTCHLHAAGYALGDHDSFERFLETFDAELGLSRLELWHINDSRDPFGSYRDRHENLDKGFVGNEVFRNIVNHSALKDIPLILETPGFDGLGPDKQNVDILKRFML